MKQLHILSVTPNDPMFAWQTRIFLSNLRKYSLSDRARILLWIPPDRISWGQSPAWTKLIADFPEVRFFNYYDTDNITGNHINTFNYIPLLRPYCLNKHFDEYPELSKDAIYYADSDTCFTKDPFFLKDEHIQDDQDYLSYTGNRASKYNYQNVDYLDGKYIDALPGKQDQYKAEDVVEQLMMVFGLHRPLFEENNQNFGGCQYLLKGITGDFWKSVYFGCIHVKLLLSNINKRLFENEDKGIQSWCSDLYSMQLNLWKLGRKTQTPEFMDFAWSTDPIEKWDTNYIYHDAGASSRPIKEGHSLYNKRDPKYTHNWISPWDEDLTWVSPDYCSKNYMKEIEEARASI